MGTVGIYIHYILYSLVLILYLKCGGGLGGGGGGCNVFLKFYAISNIYREQKSGIISRGAEGPGREILRRPPSVCPSVCLSVCLSVRHV